jgi:4-amino-4-deoxy-L-arabinose transferase-like glycosyltransferase
VNAAVAWIAGGTTALHLATANVWDYHRDEFYYLACGRRLAWGFIDHPPVTPVLYRLADTTFGSSKLGLRIVPAILHGATVLLVALLARELGGSGRAQMLAALAAALAPLVLTTGHFLGTVTVEVTVGAGLALVVVRLVNGGDPRLWLLAGALAGLGLLNKWTFAFGLAGLGVGLLLGHRDVLATPWLLAGVAVALVLWAPNVWWQAQHGWPQLEFATTLRDYGQTPIVLPAQLVILGAGAALAVPGVRWLATSGAGHPYRFLLVAVLVALVLTLATGGKPYYTAAVLPVLVAAGAVALDGTRGWVLPTVLVGVGLLVAPFAMPLTPESTAATLRNLNPELGEMIGWDTYVAQVVRLHDDHPDAAIVTRNYSEAGAVELLAPQLPQPASGHNSYWDWGPPAGEPQQVLAIGIDDPTLRRSFARLERIGTIHTPHGVHNLEDGRPIWLATGPRAAWSELWPRFRRV